MAAENKPSQEPEFVITRLFSAPRDLVFSAWIEPKHLTQWWGPRGMTTPVCQVDARKGGAYRVVMQTPTGVQYPITGVFEEISRPHRIVMTQDCTAHPAEWHDMVKPNRAKDETNPAGILHTTVTFEDAAGKTRVTIRTRFQSTAVRDAMLKMGMTEGWSLSLEKLAEHLAAAPATDREIIVSRIVDAPPELAWEAMTNPQHVGKWWGPYGFSTTIEVMDVRPGGEWKHVMHGPDGTDYPNHSVFKTIDKPRKLVYMLGGGKPGGPQVSFESTWTFDPTENGKTQVTIRMVFPSARERELIAKTYGAVEGGHQCLARMAEFVPTLR